jgi:predicted extracellular nuclease
MERVRLGEKETCFPGVRLQPLGHLSRLVARAQLSGSGIPRQRALRCTWVALLSLALTAPAPARPGLVSIPSIQGASHLSPMSGARVVTEGRVTGVAPTWFVLQDAEGDGDERTSDAVFVDSDSARVRVGDLVRLEATVAEVAPPGSPEGLPVTRLVQPAAVMVLGSRLPLPAPIVIGPGGRRIPPDALVDPAEQPIDLRDTAAVRRGRFDPKTEALDFLESLEGMRVAVKSPVAISPTEYRTSGRGDCYIWAGDSSARRPRVTAAGGILLRSGPDNFGDQNLGRLRVAFDPAISGGPAPEIATGDRLADVIGIMGYAFGGFQVNATAPGTIIARTAWRPEVTRLLRGRTMLTIATYNVLNLSADSSDDRQRRRLAAQIVSALRGPDIVALQEIQDASGERDDGMVDATPTLRKLAEAIEAAGGPRYAYVDVAPADGRPGGAPGGNIRNAYLYDTTRVILVSHRALTRELLEAAGAPEPTAFRDSRDPLEAVFEFGKRRIRLINNHLTSRFGSTPVFGAVQPYVQAGEAERGAQVRALRAYVASSRGAMPTVVLGDMNTFETTDELAKMLPGEPRLLSNLIERVEEAERYTYIFEGNSQVLDHVFVTPNLAGRTEVDVVHLNVDFPSEAPASDHDPILTRIRW